MGSELDLPQLVQQTFSKAQDAHALTFYSTKVALLSCGKHVFQLRYSEALAHKPKAVGVQNDSRCANPFESPEPALFVKEIGPSHQIVLNVFPVIPEHFLLLTKRFKPQTHLLELDDFEAVFACLKEYGDAGQDLFGFFNSGSHSGASQPHRHVQFLPIQSMRSGMSRQDVWSPLIDTLTGTEYPTGWSKRDSCPSDALLIEVDLPFTYYAESIVRATDHHQLYEAYQSLHAKAVDVATRSGIPLVQMEGESSISYNLAITRQTMVLCPRTAEGVTVRSIEGHSIGPIAFNGTLLAGTLLVKNEREWNALRSGEINLDQVLRSVGIPPDDGEPQSGKV